MSSASTSGPRRRGSYAVTRTCCSFAIAARVPWSAERTARRSRSTPSFMPTTDDTAEARAVELACDLIARPSVTPDDQGCQELLIRRLIPLGFTVERLPFGPV